MDSKMPQDDVLAAAPLFVQRRYNSIRGYVRALIETEFPLVERRLSREDRELIQIASLIYTLHHFFEDGHHAARNAVRILRRLKISELRIGSQVFAENSEATLRGRRLADDLLSQIQNETVRNLIVSSSSLGHLVRALLLELDYA